MYTNILIIDIETVPQYADYGEMPETWQVLFEKKEQYAMEGKGLTPEACYARKGGILAEFGQVVAIGLGILRVDVKEAKGAALRVTVLSGKEEKALLQSFAEGLGHRGYEAGEKKISIVCGHNIREFDVPYLCRRLLIHRMPIPKLINWQGKKPWALDECVHDTFQLWRFGDYKHYTSLDLLCACLGVSSSKTDSVDGSLVKDLYYEADDLPAISDYCQRDVVATAQVYLRLRGYDVLPETSITHGT